MLVDDAILQIEMGILDALDQGIDLLFMLLGCGC